MKKIFSVVLVFVLLFGLCLNTYANEAGVGIQTDSVVNIEPRNEGVLLDSITFAVDKYGNVQQIDPNQRGWFADHTVNTFFFYDTGVTAGKHYFEVHMYSNVDDPDFYYTKHVFSAKPTRNTNWMTHEIRHAAGDHKTSIGDSICYSYPADDVPANPRVQVKATFTLADYGTYSLGPFTLTKPMT